jgi:hypothetical protein
MKDRRELSEYRMCSRHLIAIAALTLAAVVFAHPAAAESEQSADCIHREVTFNGTTPLTYATVKPDAATGRVALHHEYPQACDAGNNFACSSKAYLLSGDTVAISKTCGDWAYLQYIGDAHVNTGWALKARLSMIPKKLPFDDGPPPGFTPDDTPATAKMTIAMGQGRPVCEAYSQRINQTIYYEPPYCGRPENDQVPGFSRLNRIILTPKEVTALYGQVEAFLLRSRSLPVQEVAPSDLAGIGKAASDHLILVWGYDPRLDINNDGTTRNIVVWTGDPVSSSGKACGDMHLLNGNLVSFGYVREQLAFALSDDGSLLDDDNSKQIFGHPTGGHSVPENSPHLDISPQYKALGNSISFFRYRDQVYFDTFFEGDGWPDFDGKRAKLRTLRNHLAVFIRKDGATKQMCEYVYHPK